MNRSSFTRQFRCKKPTYLNIFYQNVRGLKTKLKDWRNNLLVSENQIVAVTETFLDNSVSDTELTVDQWSIIRRDRNTPCGGVLLAVRTPIVQHRQFALETDYGEDIWASLVWSGQTFNVCVVYIKPSASDSEYMRWFSKVESFVNDLKGVVLILGDLNLNSASTNIKNYFCYFVSYCNLNEFNDIVNVHGRILDVVLIREGNEVHEVHVQTTDGLVKPDNYHPPLNIEILTSSSCHLPAIERSNIDPNKDWNFKKCNYSLLRALLSETSWCNVINSNDVQSSTDQFYDIIYNIFDICIPYKRRKNGHIRRYPVWFTVDIIKDIKHKSQLHSAWKQNGTIQAYAAFSNLRTALKTRVAVAYENHLKSIEANLCSNPQGFWRHISSLRSKGGFEPSVTYMGETFSGIKASEAFANYFASVFLKEMPLLDADSRNHLDNNSTSNVVNIPRISSTEVVSGIKALKLNSSVGPDNVPSWFIKQGQAILAHPLSHIYNLSLNSGIYPSQWKLSRVTPIPKTSDRASVEHYRPIAILSSPAKIFEHIIHKEIYKQVEHILCNEQHGFRKKRSVNTNLLTAVEYISAGLDIGAQVDVLYLDFCKAFDRVNNDILLAKLSMVGFVPGLLRLVADYLRDRQQYVRQGLYESHKYHTRSGVNQGSILGPLLFVLMINDLPAVTKHSMCLLYADDLKLMYKIKSKDDCLRLQYDVDAICNWGVRNKMEFNVTKCCTMTFGRKKHLLEFNYKLGDSVISRVSTTKDLGVTFDQKLTFHEHINSLAKETFRRLGFVLRNSRDFKSDHVVRLIYCALVRSKLDASSCVWHPYETKYTLLLEKIQKAFLRFLYKRVNGYYPFMYPTKFLLGSLGYNSLEVRRKNDQLTTMLKIISGRIDAPYLHNKLQRFYIPNNYRRNRHHRLFSVPSHRTVARARSPIPRTLAALNALLDSNPSCDLYADDWKTILTYCLQFCEVTV